MLSVVLALIPVVITIIAGIVWIIAVTKNDPGECDPEDCKNCPYHCDKDSRKE